MWANYRSFLTCKCWLTNVDLQMLTCKCWLANVDLQMLCCLANVDLQMLTCKCWLANVDLQMLTCQSNLVSHFLVMELHEPFWAWHMYYYYCCFFFSYCYKLPRKRWMIFSNTNYNFLKCCLEIQIHKFIVFNSIWKVWTSSTKPHGQNFVTQISSSKSCYSILIIAFHSLSVFVHNRFQI